MTSAQIRQSFLDFFKSKGHTIVPSASLLPDSPNLLFTNAGMNQFVPIFLGQRKADVSKWAGSIPGSDTRAADTQKCIRAGGKHNDLEDVGLDTYHHTFFEMLGNWSFGDYFKKEAIDWAWELITEIWKFPKNRLYATVYSPDKSKNDPSDFDQEAFDIWAEKFRAAGLDPKVHIVNGNKKDNFWMMGETGPCGPCSEIHVDLTPNGDTQGSLVNKGDARCIEIWNLVFIQFNANVDGTFSPLPAKHVDTGMGFERVTGIIQNTNGFTDFKRIISNYETDIFRPIFDKLEKLSGKKYHSTLPQAGSTGDTEQEKIDVAFRVIADHIRMLSFSIADGIEPGNKERNGVVRRILRRAGMFGRCLGFEKPFLYRLVPVLADAMGHVFSEVRIKQDHIEQVVKREEELFHGTLGTGMALFEEYVSGVEGARLKARNLDRQLPRVRERISKLPDGKPAKSNRLIRLKHEFEAEIGEVLQLALDPIQQLNAQEESASMLFDPIYPLIKAIGPLIKLVNEAQKEVDTDEAYNKLLRDYEEEVVKAQSHLLKLANGRGVISGVAAFTLSATYGFPVEETERLARERGFVFDGEGYKWHSERHQALSRAAQRKQIIELSQVETSTPTQFTGFDKLESHAKVIEVVGIKDKTAVIVDSSPLYAEMGGQVGDTGKLSSGGRLWQIANTQKAGNTWLHFLADNDSPEVGAEVQLSVDRSRRNAIQRHHSVTHLLHWALHEVVSRDASQKGSYVGPEKLTFDFNGAALTPAQIADIEKLVNERVLENASVSWTEVPYSEIKACKDVMQFFGDKYGEQVRVVQIGGKPSALDGYSMELCGGTHTRATGEIGLFRIVAESAIAAGVRRIEAVAGLEAYKVADQQLQLVKTMAGKLNTPVADLEKKIEALLVQQKELEKQLKSSQQKEAAETARTLVTKAKAVGSVQAIIENLGIADGDFLQSIVDSLKVQFKGVVVLAGASNESVSLVVTVSPEFTKQIQAGKIIQTIAPIVGGKGGGRPDNARGGGKDVTKMDEALAKAKTLIA